MSKKYYSLDEAAALLGMPREELNRLREKGEIRGFADRGTWKFREEDLDKLKRSRQMDSDPEVPMFHEDAPVPGEGSGILSDELEAGLADSGHLLADDEDPGEQPTEVRKRSPLTSSDSDVRLAIDGLDSDSDVKLISDQADSDSDVKLISDEADSDSDVKLIGEDEDSDSDVKLVGDTTDSEVRLVDEGRQGGGLDGTQPILPQIDEADSDSDVRLVDSDSDIRLSPAEEDVALLAGEDSSIALDFAPDDSQGASVLSDESGLGLGGSSLLLTGESGVSLEGPSDSGVALHVDDEGITLPAMDEDSGISLDMGTGSDITLDTGSDSGISLEAVNDSGISLDDSIELGAGTVAMMDIPSDDEIPETQYEIPVGAGDSAFDLQVADSEDEMKTGVLNLQDSGEATLDDAVFELDEEESDDVFGGGYEDADDLEVADEILGEDDELDELDVFDADDDVFGGEGGPRFAAPVAAAGGPYVEAQWGVGTIIGLAISSICLLLCGVVMHDLVQHMWAWGGEHSTVAGMILQTFSGLYGG